MKDTLLKTIIVMFLASLLPTASKGQGRAEDYRRAYSLYGKFRSENVAHWAHDIKWKDSSTIFYYYVDSPEGRKYISYDVASGTARNFTSEDEMRKSLSLPLVGRIRRDSPFRKHERHWMETDDEQQQRVVVSPDGKKEAWIEGYNVVVHDAGTSYTEKRTLTQDGTLGRYYSSNIIWSPDSRKIFVCRRNKVERRYVYYVESSPRDQLQPVLHKQEYAKPGDELPQYWPSVIDITTGRKTEPDHHLLENQYSLSWFQWTPDSRLVTMEYNRRGHQLYQLLALDVESGEIHTVAEEKSNTFVNYGRIWRQFINGGRQVLWTSERDNWNHIYLFDVTSTGKKENGMRQITKGKWCVRKIQYVDEVNKVIYFSASGMNEGEDPYLVYYYRIGFDGKNLVCLTPCKGNHTVVFSSDMKYLVDTYSMVDRAPVTELRSGDNGRLLHIIEKSDTSRLAAAGWVAPEVFVAKGRDGVTDIWGIIQRPTNFDPSRKYPVIEYIYAGPGDAYTPKSFIPYNWNMTALAELGFIVVQLDGMGTSYRGKVFEDVCYKNLQDAGFPDRELWIRAAARKYPYMDAENVGIFGASAGGQEAATAVMLHGDFYKAAYSSCGCHDNRMDKIWWNEQWMGWPVDSSYVRASNVYNATKLERPLMLVVGELDDNVDPSSTMQVVNALVKAGKDFELVVLPGVNHTMGESYGEHKRFDFFVKKLLYVNPPEWKEVK